MAVFSASEVHDRLSALPNWTLVGSTIVRELRFQNFIEAIGFVNQLVEPAEIANHHPDLAISYNKVVITLTTHDAGGLTAKDFDLAAVIDRLSSAAS
ncbi:MAG TPA: 4a-hydroxytetrahydrobiopterin dehydratase [Coleofasciculaceae cyanobacterium]